MARVNIVCGSTGAGKTTFARALAEELGAARFSIDEWMGELFWPDQQPGADYRWAIERVERCERQIWSVSRDLLKIGCDVVLDLGFTESVQRRRFIEWAQQAGGDPVIHYLDVDAETRRRRVHERNRAKDGTYVFHVDDEMFDFMENLFEPPTAGEGATVLIVPAK